MHKLKMIIWVALLTSLTAIAKPVERDPYISSVNQTMSAFMQQHAVPGAAVLLYVAGKPYGYYYGYADLQQKKPISKASIFEIGALSDLMTSLLVAQEVDFAKMAFNDPITKYIPGLPSTFKKVTLQHLATNTSGLPQNAPATVTTLPALKQYLAHSQLDNLNTEWRHSHLGMGLLGLTVENETEKSFDKLYLRHILVPLKMQPITSEVPKNLMRFYAQGYDETGKPVPHVALRLFPSNGGLKAAAVDMQRFLAAAIGLPTTPERVLYPMYMTQSIYVKLPEQLQGLGWHIHPYEQNHVHDLIHGNEHGDTFAMDVEETYDRPLYKNTMLMDKTGTTHGFGAYIAVLPDKKSGIVILTNKYIPDSSLQQIGREILFKVAS